MTTRDAKMTWAWAAIAIFIAVAVSYVFAGQAHANAPTLHETIVAAVPSLGSKKEPTVDADDFAYAIVDVANGNRQWVALLMTIAISESALSERVRLDQYFPHEGDSFVDTDGSIGHRASGLWQVHRNSTNADVWGSHDLTVQAKMASRLARGAFYMCKRAGVPFPLGVFRALGSGSCTMPLPGEEKRMALFSRLMRRL